MVESTPLVPPGTHVQAAMVLVVDDEPSLRRLLAFNLERDGHRVATAVSGEEALERIDAEVPDLVLLDLMLPGIDGLETLSRLRRTHPELPVIVLTAHGSVENAVEAMKLGAQDFLTKPFDMDRLRIAVRNALEIGQLAREVRKLRSELGSRYSFEGIVGIRGGLRETVLLLEKVIPTDLTVLLQGESGTGKELFARAIHFEGPRREGPFVAINCAALPESLLESELFGHEKGSFTGAHEARSGKFEQADGGTLLLDEIGELSLAVQAKLLRVLQEKTVTRLGGDRPVRVDVRIIAATNRDLAALVRKGLFREDLYYRLSVFPVTIPPLRERKEDLPELVDHLLREACPGGRCRILPETMEILEAHEWPGNVRELYNVLRRALVIAGDDPIAPEHLPPYLLDRARAVRETGEGGETRALDPSSLPTLEEVERQHIVRVLHAHRGNLSLAARTLGIGRTTLYRKLEKYGLHHRGKGGGTPARSSRRANAL